MNSALVASLLSILVVADAATAPTLIRPGQFHGDEVQAESGSGWLGLFPVGDEFELRPTSIQVSRVNDPIVDNENEATGKKVAVPETHHQPVFLIRGVDGLSAGPVTTVFSGREAYKII